MTGEAQILVTGGSGLLGGELKKLLPEALFPAHEEFNVENPALMDSFVEGRDIQLILHAAAFTSPPRINENPENALSVNIIGTSNVTALCMRRNIRLVYVSTDYVFSGDKGAYTEDDPVFPVNKYAWSKLGGECAVRMHDDSMIIRTSFGENQFPYEKAFIDQWTSRQSVTEIAEKIASLLQNMDYRGVIHVGGPRRTVYEYALSVAQGKEIGELSVKDVSFNVPVDTSFNISRYLELTRRD